MEIKLRDVVEMELAAAQREEDGVPREEVEENRVTRQPGGPLQTREVVEQREEDAEVLAGDDVVQTVSLAAPQQPRVSTHGAIATTKKPLLNYRPEVDVGERVVIKEEVPPRQEGEVERHQFQQKIASMRSTTQTSKTVCLEPST